MPKLIATINNGEVKLFCRIGGDITFSHHEKHKIVKGYIQTEKVVKNGEVQDGDTNI